MPSMYCQSCGTSNPEDAKFCKACGTRIAGPGDKGGPIPDDTVQVMETLPGGRPETPESASETVRDPAAAPEAQAGRSGEAPAIKPDASGAVSIRTLPPELSAADTSGTISRMSISLAEVGIRSPRRIGLMALGIALALFALGAGGMYLVMFLTRPEQSSVASVPEPRRFNPKMAIGFPEPEGSADEVGGEDRPRRRPAGQAPARGGSSEPTETPASGSSGPPSKAPAEGGSASSKAGGSGSLPAGGTGEAPSKTPGSGGSGGGSGGSGGGSGGSGGGSSGGGSGGSSPFDDPASLPGGTVEDTRDLEMDAYAGRVRRVIREYYAARARNCYDRATRNNPYLRGTVLVRFTIGTDGNVRNASITHNTTGDESLGRCIAGQIGTWRLPPPPRDEPVVFEMPFSW